LVAALQCVAILVSVKADVAISCHHKPLPAQCRSFEYHRSTEVVRYDGSAEEVGELETRIKNIGHGERSQVRDAAPRHQFLMTLYTGITASRRSGLPESGRGAPQPNGAAEHPTITARSSVTYSFSCISCAAFEGGLHPQRHRRDTLVGERESCDGLKAKPPGTVSSGATIHSPQQCGAVITLGFTGAWPPPRGWW